MTGNFELLVGLEREVDRLTLAERLDLNLSLLVRLLAVERLCLGIEVKLGVLGASERPFVLVTELEMRFSLIRIGARVAFADKQFDRGNFGVRSFMPTSIVLAL